MDRRGYDVRGPAANGSFGSQYPNRGEGDERREERRTERQEERDAAREERRENWQEYAEDYYDDRYDGGYYDDGYGGGYYEEEEPGVYWTLPCRPNVIAFGGATYYVCDSTWYIRVYSDGEVAYTVVPPPTGP